MEITHNTPVLDTSSVDFNYDRARKNAVSFLVHIFLVIVSVACLFPL